MTKDIEKIAKNYQDQIRHIDVTAINKYVKSLDLPKIAELHQVAEKQHKLLSEQIRKTYDASFKGLAIEAQKLSKQYSGYLKRRQLLEEQAKKTLQLYTKSFLEEEPKLKDSIVALINIGWYPDIEDFGIGTLLGLKDDIEKTDVKDIDAAFVDYYQEIVNDIKEKVIRQFPHREHILYEAFEAHKAKNYIVSIPLLLTQIDGLAYDIFKKSFFEKSKGKQIPKVSEALEEDISTFRLVLLVPFLSEQPIIYNKKQRDENFNHLNRHQVVHGEIVNYHTEENSCKAISLLYYIAQAGLIIKDNDEGKSNEK